MQHYGVTPSNDVAVAQDQTEKLALRSQDNLTEVGQAITVTVPQHYRICRGRRSPESGDDRHKALMTRTLSTNVDSFLSPDIDISQP